MNDPQTVFLLESRQDVVRRDYERESGTEGKGEDKYTYSSKNNKWMRRRNDTTKPCYDSIIVAREWDIRMETVERTNMA